MFKVTISYANSKVTGNFTSLIDATGFINHTAEGHGEPERVTVSQGNGSVAEEEAPRRRPGRPKGSKNTSA